LIGDTLLCLLEEGWVYYWRLAGMKVAMPIYIYAHAYG